MISTTPSESVSAATPVVRRPPLPTTPSTAQSTTTTSIAQNAKGATAQPSHLSTAERSSNVSTLMSRAMSGSGAAANSFRPSILGGGVNRKVSITHDEYAHTSTVRTAYHSALLGCGVERLSGRVPSGPHQATCCGDTCVYNIHSRWWQGCIEAVCLFPCIVAAQRKFLLAGPPPPLDASCRVASESTCGRSQLGGDRAFVPMSMAVDRTAVAGADGLSRPTSPPMALPTPSSPLSRCCYLDCAIATVLPCVAVWFGVQNRHLMEKYHFITDAGLTNEADVTPRARAAAAVQAGLSEDPANGRRRTSTKLSGGGGPPPGLQHGRTQRNQSTGFRVSALCCPCCSTAQIGRELELRGVGGSVRLRAPTIVCLGAEEGAPESTSTPNAAHASASSEAFSVQSDVPHRRSADTLVWVPFYPETAEREVLQQLSRDFWDSLPMASSFAAMHRSAVNSLANQQQQQMSRSSSPTTSPQHNTPARGSRSSPTGQTLGANAANPLVVGEAVPMEETQASSPRVGMVDDAREDAHHLPAKAMPSNHLSVLLGDASGGIDLR